MKYKNMFNVYTDCFATSHILKCPKLEIAHCDVFVPYPVANSTAGYR